MAREITVKLKPKMIENIRYLIDNELSFSELFLGTRNSLKAADDRLRRALWKERHETMKKKGKLYKIM
jgi:hypothetical protein